MHLKEQDLIGNGKPTTLYIIGNGFDLWHGIPSGYEHFKEYVRLHDRDLFQAVENYLPAGDNWWSLESALAEIDIDNIIDDNSQFMASYGADDWSDSGHHDFQYEVEQVVEQLSTHLRARFGEWIRTLSIPTSTTALKFLRRIETDAAFLTFNYTSTLQRLYGVREAQILHIHGEAKMPDSELILGHGLNPAQHKSLNDRDDIEDLDTRLMEAHSILDEHFLRTFKPSDELIRQYRSFFDHLDAVKSVYVLGHSLSDVDLPYLQALLRNHKVATAEWHVACRNEDERLEKRNRLIQLGVGVKNAVADLWEDYY